MVDDLVGKADTISREKQHSERQEAAAAAAGGPEEAVTGKGKGKDKDKDKGKSRRQAGAALDIDQLFEETGVAGSGGEDLGERVDGTAVAAVSDSTAGENGAKARKRRRKEGGHDSRGNEGASVFDTIFSAISGRSEGGGSGAADDSDGKPKRRKVGSEEKKKKKEKSGKPE